MFRRAPLALPILTAIVLLARGAFYPVPASSNLPAGEFWRLPWRADAAHSISGYGYGEGTHDGGEKDSWPT
jgi:hypothetical protein